MATQYVTCPRCSAQNSALNTQCLTCGATLPVQPMPMARMPEQRPQGAEKKIAAGICGIVLGGLGIHKFILGYQQEGIILLATYLVSFIIAMVTCGIGTPLILIPTIVGIIEGIIYLTKSDEEFVQTYIRNKKPWF
ncbi:MAG TPA: TM2 domain-containing protein [Pyrinomonadaceae bacterium]|nr:TM2 domain-containing protein [Pyrinomonadaceae bacterium]